MFESLKEAEENLEECCQDGQIIPLNTNVMQILEDCEEFISSVIGDNPEDYDIKELTNTLDEVLDIK